MISTLLFDFSRVLLFPKDKTYTGELNPLHRKLSTGFNYRIFDYFQLNEELLGFLNTKREEYGLYIFTTGTIQNVPEIQVKVRKVFLDIYSAEELGLSKKEPRGYLAIAEKIQKDPREILYVDDSLKNVQTAQTTGMQTIHFLSNEQVTKELETFLAR